MILQTSLFNKGIYKSTLRRFYLGSLAYFILLFMVSSMIILLTNGDSYRYDTDHSYLLSSGLMQVATIISVAAPSVAALLIYRFVHSKKASVFVHSLPVCRTANYLSSLAAGLTLMALPIILNGLILVAMALSGQWPYLITRDCLIWIGINILTIFIMFSYSGICAMLTGNSFALVGLNILIHCFIPLIIASFGQFSECFLYGYAGNNVVLNFVCDNNPIMLLSSLTYQVSYSEPHIDVSKIVWHIIVAVILYALTLVLYKKRRIETAEDVAAYKCLNPIYKYLLTFLSALITFAILEDVTSENPAWVMWIMLIVSTVVYFAIEMILKKTFKIWKRAFMGYITFVASLAIVFGVFSCTSFFGYESYIPNADDISSTSVYNYYHQGEQPYTEDTELINATLDIHKNLMQNRPTNKFAQNDYNADKTRIHVEYMLKNGRKIRRVYPVSYDDSHKYMNKLYTDADYKKTCEKIFDPNIKKIYEADFLHRDGAQVSGEKCDELIASVKKDILSLDYDRIYTDSAEWNCSISITYATENDEKSYVKLLDGSTRFGSSADISINNNYEHTIKWLKDNGYWDEIKPQVNPDIKMYLCSYKDYMDTLEMDRQIITKKGSYVSGVDVPENAVEIDQQKVCDVMENYKPYYLYGDDYYVIANYTDGQFYPAYDIDEETAKLFTN